MNTDPEKLQLFRHPMVAATGIMLGFILNFMTEWVPTVMTRNLLVEIIIGTSLLTCIPLLLLVLFRILNMHYPEKDADMYYKRTLRMFITGISIPFIAMFLILIYSIVNRGVRPGM